MNFATTTLTAILTLATATGAMADANSARLSEAQRAEVQSACAADIKSYCRSSFTPNASIEDAMKACLRTHMKSFSTGCKRTLIEVRLHSG